jgi:hypothetical protein
MKVALFSMIKWPCFQLSKYKQDGQSGPLFGDQVALFSFDKNNQTFSVLYWFLLSSDGLLGQPS